MNAKNVAPLRKVVAIVAAALMTLAWKSSAAHAWHEQARLTAEIHIGGSVALSGSHAVIGGGLGLLHFDPGAAVIFEENLGNWTRSQTLSSDERCGLEGCSFGFSVDLENDRLVVGAPYIGKTFVFEKAMGAWHQTAVLLPAGPTAGSSFGHDVDLQGDRIAVSSHDRVYVFDRASGAWNLTTELNTGSTGAGRSISLDGDRVLVSGEGTAFLFENLNAPAAEVKYLSPPNLPPFSNFGVSVALDGNHALVGADYHDESGLQDSGAAYLFTHEGDEWVTTAKLLPDDPKQFAHFGLSLSLEGGRALITAPHFDQSPGEAYIFERGAGGGWLQTAKLPLEGFGGSGRPIAVQFDGDRAILGGNGQAVIFIVPEPSAWSLVIIVLLIAPTHRAGR